MKRRVLNHFTVTPYQDMGRDLESLDAGEKRMFRRVQAIGKQLFNIRPAEFARRHTDSVHHD